MHQRTCIHGVVMAAALIVAAGLARPAHAQGNLQAFPEPNGAVFVTWLGSPDPGVVGYNVYRRETTLTADKATRMNADQPITASSILDSGLTLGKPVTYFVRAVSKDASGALVEGPNSGESSATPQSPTKLPPGDFLYYDIDTALPGSVTLDGNALTIRASGPPLWERADGQTFLAMPVTGDYQITVAITAHPENDAADDNPSGNAKVGLEIRADLFKGGPYGNVFSSADRDPPVFIEGRRSYVGGTGAYSTGSQTGEADTPYPLWLRLVKQKATITGFESIDGGKTYQQVGDPQDLGSLPPVTYAGIFVSADRDGQYTIGKLDASSLKIEPK
jgi:hypothetical protein